MRKSILAVAVAAATIVSGANAAGFYLKEQSVVGQGRAFAGSAAGTDGASAAYFNPAGIVGLERQVEVGVHLISPDVVVTNNGTSGTDLAGGNNNTIKPYETKAVPNMHFIQPIDDETALSVAVGAPFGFSNDYGNNAFNRSDNIKVDLTTIELTASIAKAISNKSSVAFSLVYQTQDVEQTFGQSALPVSVKQTGSGSALGFALSAQHKVSAATTIGFSHRTQNTVELTGKLVGGAYGAGASYKADFELPSITALGVVSELTETTRVYADLTHYGWSAYDKLTAIATEQASVTGLGTIPVGGTLNSANNNYRDTVSVGLGGEHDYGHGLTVRAGIHIDPTPTNDSDRSTSTPDSDRTWLATGFSKELASGLIIDGAFTHILADDGKISKATPSRTRVDAKVESSVNILSLGLRYKF